MARYDDTFVDRFLEPWNRHDVDGALALMTDDCVWEVTRGREPHGTLYTGRAAVRLELPRFGGGFTAFAHTGNSSRFSYAMGDK